MFYYSNVLGKTDGKLTGTVAVKGGRKRGIGAALGSRKAEKEGWEAYEIFDSTAKLSKDVRKNAVDVKAIINDDKPLIARDFKGADSGIPNKLGGEDNCVNVILANEMLRIGINVTAKFDYIPEFGEDKYTELFLSKRNEPVNISLIVTDNEHTFLSKIKKELREGRYVIGWNDYNDAQLARLGVIKEEDTSGHVLSAEVTPSGLKIYDHQDKFFVNIKTIFQNRIWNMA